MTDQTKAVWHEIDPSTLDQTSSKAYAEYKAAFASAKALREKFETSLRSQVKLPEGRRLAIAYNFGKLSVANVADEERKSTGSKKATSLKAAFAA